MSRSRITLLAVALLAIAIQPALADEEKAPQRQPEIEVVFVLDTTGSMSGLIQAAKDKVWAIANTLATAEPAPTIRFGLIGYRDKGDDYVTRSFQLSEDLDAAYTDLFDYQAQGGGDTPEAVNRALNEAVTLIEWSTDPHVHRVIYLVGDCPPHLQEEGEVPYLDSCAMAVEKDIVINTIQCGTHGETTPIWQEIAQRGYGKFAQIAQSGGVVVKATPWDEEIARLSAERDATRVWFGNAAEVKRQSSRLSAIDAVSEAAPAAQKAARGAYNISGAGNLNFYAVPKATSGREADQVKELVLSITDGDFDWENEEQVAQLPEGWKDLSPEEQKVKAAAIAAQRKELAKKIAELSQKRQQHLADELKRSGEEIPELDRALFDSISEQAAKKGLRFESGPKF